MTYAQARWAGVRAGLLPWLKRVALVLLLSLAAASGGSGDPLTLLQVLAGSAAWSVMPLHQAGFLGPLLQATVVWLLLFALRGVLQPARWLAHERSWPLDPAELRRGDARLALLALSPLLALQLAGLLALAQPLTALSWLLGSALGWGLGLQAMARRRAGPRPARPTAPTLAKTPPHTGALSPAWALLVLPLVRGPLRRSGGLLAVQALALAALPALLWSPLPAAWLAMAWVALAWLGLQRANAWLDADMAPLVAALPPLPLDLVQWQRRLRRLALLPWLVAALPVLAAVALSPHAVRGGVATLLGLLLLAFGVWSAQTRLQADDQHAVRQLLGLALLLALASELFAA